MPSSTILVLGGSGFIGRHVVARLARPDSVVVVPTRHRERAKHLLMLPWVDIVQADMSDRSVLATLVRRADVVVNLVGVLHSSPGTPYGPAFKRAHVDLPARLVEACDAAGAGRLLHVSALGVDLHAAHPLPSMYLRSKADGERAIHAAQRTRWTIFRPSVVFGPEDSFLNLFAALQRRLPVMPLARGATRFSPVWVCDVAQAVVNAIDSPDTVGRTYELGGPEVFTLRELVALAGRLAGTPRPIIDLPDGLGRLQAGVLEHMPGPTLMSRDNFDSLAIDNVASTGFAPELRVTPSALSGIAPGYIGRAPSAVESARLHAHR